MLEERIIGLAEPVPIVRLADSLAHRAAVVAQEDTWLLIDDLDRPVVLVQRQPRRHDTSHASARWTVPMRARENMPVVALVGEALARPAIERFDPVVCCDATGRLIGVVHLERAVMAALDSSPVRSLTA